MKIKSIHGTDLKCSEVILGTDYYGESISKENANKFMDRYIENGGNTIDTARLYTCGKSERIIGEYLKNAKCRQNIVISTKCAHPPIENMRLNRLSKSEIEQDVNNSLMALQTDYIDILWLHRDDESVPCEEIIDSLNDLVKDGKIRYFGASNWRAKRIASANEYASKHGLCGFIASQIQWSAAKPAKIYDSTLVIMDQVEYDFYKNTKMPVFAYSAQAKGFFEKYDKNCLSEKARTRYFCYENIEMYKKIKEISLKSGYSLSSVALSLITNNRDFIGFPIINCSDISQLEDSLGVTEISESYFNLFD